MFDVFCLGVALAVGQGGPAAPPPVLPVPEAGRVTVGDDLPKRIPPALPAVGVPETWAPARTVSQDKRPAGLAPVTPVPSTGKKDEAPGGTRIEQKEAEKPDEDKKDEEKKDEEKKPEEKGHLMKLLEGTPHGCWLEQNRITISGFTEASYTWSNHGRMNWPMLFQSPTNEFLLNQNWLTIEKTVDTEAKCPTWGFRVDAVVPGSDARFIHQRGLVDDQHGKYQWDPYQFYVQYYDPNFAKGLDVKVGRIAVPFMAEVTPAYLNPLFSHSYAYYYNPFTLTGVAATVTMSDEFAVGFWATLGNDVWFDDAAQGFFLTTLQWTSTDKNDTALLSIGLSNNRFSEANNFGQQNIVDLVYTHKFDDKYKYMLDAGIGWERDVPGIGNTCWSWMVNYWIYDMSDQVSYACRLEAFHDADGFRTGSEGLYLAGTAGVTLKPKDSVLIRPEIRYDYNTESKPFNGQHGVLTLAADFIVRW